MNLGHIAATLERISQGFPKTKNPPFISHGNSVESYMWLCFKAPLKKRTWSLWNVLIPWFKLIRCEDPVENTPSKQWRGSIALSRSLKRISSWTEGRVLKPACPDLTHLKLAVALPTAARWNQLGPPLTVLCPSQGGPGTLETTWRGFCAFLGWKERSHWVELSVENLSLVVRRSQGIMWALPRSGLVTSSCFPSVNLSLLKRIDCPPS